WVFMALYVFLTHAYLPKGLLHTKRYSRTFILLQVANVGMLVTFPFMGYAFWSILFSALHAVLAMGFAWVFIRDVSTGLPERHYRSFQFVKWGLILMVLSNLAPFALGPVSATQGKGDLYYLLIYFYLHFQYNGWFTFALLGLVFWQLEEQGIGTNNRLLKVGFRLKLFAIFPAYILSALWIDPGSSWYLVAGLAAATQLIGLAYLIVFMIRHIGSLINGESKVLKMLLFAGVLAIGMQHVLMLLSAFPSLAALAFARNIVIAYLHMVLLGFVSVWIFFLALKCGFLRASQALKAAFILFLAAFVVTELVLVFQGVIVNSAYWLFVLAVSQLTGLVIITMHVKKKSTLAL
ncbi:MAG: hypothetical protein RJQ14_19010, partial [Marinoscillum sp.]